MVEASALARSSLAFGVQAVLAQARKALPVLRDKLSDSVAMKNNRAMAFLLGLWTFILLGVLTGNTVCYLLAMLCGFNTLAEVVSDK